MKRYLVAIISILFSSSALSLSLAQQRAVYSEAVQLQEKNRWDEANQKLSTITLYPLTYLLQYRHLKSNFSAESREEISAFIDKNKQHKISDDLERAYLYYLANNEYWSDFLHFYPEIPRSKKLKCFHFQAKMAQKKQNEIWPEVKKMWLSGYSKPTACNVVFDFYLDNKKISQSLIWQRFELAYIANKKGLMSHLINLMEGSNKALAKQLYTLNKNPRQLTKSKLFDSNEQLSYPLLKTSLKRLAKVDINLALQVYDSYEKIYPFSASDEVQLKRYFSSRILIKNEQKLLPWLDDTIPTLGDTKLIEQRIRYAIKYNNWSDIERWIAQLPLAEKNKTTWVYWQARVLENKLQPENAEVEYRKIAGERKYYGFLAAQKLGLSYELNAQLVKPKVASLDNLQPQLDHIEELYFHQHFALAKREWEALLKANNIDIQRQAGLYAFDKGWAHLSVLASIRSKSWDAINIRFPEAESQLFLENAKKYKIPQSYIYAITRQESSFDQFANSPAGATGYMQLMPQTAKETARKIGLKSYKKKTQLTEGQVNIQLGTAYFNSLLKRYDGNRILATAAYNAGPHRVNRWQKDKKGRDNKALSMDSWVEAIPYSETRRYVKNVLAYNVIYQHVMKAPMEFFNATELNAVY